MSLSDPIQTMKPGDHGKRVRRFSLEVTNSSAEQIKNVQVKMTSFVNRERKQSNHLGARFSWSVDRGDAAPHRTYTQFMDIAAQDSEVVDIAQLDESMAEHVRRVTMLHAPPEGVAYGSHILANVFPHDLTVRVTADGLVKPIDKSFKLLVNERGQLDMTAN